MREAAHELERRLVEAGTEERAAASKAYLKSSMRFVGATVPQTRTVVRDALRAHPEWSPAQVRELAQVLWDEPAGDPLFERRQAALLLLTEDRERARRTDFAQVERLLRDSTTWALVDGLSTDVAGDLVERFPELAAELDRWAVDDNFWIRRAALLSLLLPLRRGEGDWEHFTRLADPMLTEREFFIRKAIGWVLRETSKLRPELVADWVRPRLARMSRVTLREAVRRMPPELARTLASTPGEAGRSGKLNRSRS